MLSYICIKLSFTQAMYMYNCFTSCNVGTPVMVVDFIKLALQIEAYAVKDTVFNIVVCAMQHIGFANTVMDTCARKTKLLSAVWQLNL